MEKTWHWLLLVLFFIPIAIQAHTLRLTSGEYAPFISQSISGGGPITEIVMQTAQEADFDVSLGYFPWHESMSLAQQGKWDGTIGWAYTPERADNFIYSDPIYTESVGFFHLTTLDFDWQLPRDLDGLSIGVTKGFIDVKALEELQKSGIDVKIQEFLEEKNKINALLNRQIDVALGNLDVLKKVIAQHVASSEQQRLVHHPRPMRITPLYVLFSRANKSGYDNAARFNKALRQLKADGRYQSIWSKFRNTLYTD
ncbi:ABC transporter substrate-binding protein [Salinivibrio sp. ES.052]|uniref:substrate-binding periplasmic protein n=1 Tax=Salinivibrio sp. ES.052 TaxID=1882823 RepID=UPI00092BD67D|nr:transporter substrate-binding domain-containing protein [Salinivibrio sp. ES.052]SIO01621.1 ABC-type amino acid transport substrate-binding protein [Salinivibrio sp. ES.052]